MQYYGLGDEYKEIAEGKHGIVLERVLGSRNNFDNIILGYDKYNIKTGGKYVSKQKRNHY